MSGRLELRADSGSLRHYLEGRPVPTGTTLEILLPGDRWLRGRFVDTRTRPPVLHIELGGQREEMDAKPIEAAIQLPPDAILRWPKSSAAAT